MVSTHWPAYVEAQGRTLPAFVVREVEAYLKCGILEHGLLRVGCASCGFEHLVAFPCTKRGFCPSCLGRRMTDTACHLRERVLPSSAEGGCFSTSYERVVRLAAMLQEVGCDLAFSVPSQR